MKRVIHFLLIVLLTVGCSQKDNHRNLLDEFMNTIEESNVQIEDIYHAEIVRDGVLVFYRNQIGLAVGFLRQKQGNWEWVAGGQSVQIKSESDLIWSAINLDEVPLYLFCGVINNSEIEQIKTQKPNGSLLENAKIIQTKENMKIWFTTYEMPVNTPFDVIATTEDGRVLYP